jgi:MOSC domain-containing protein YiiM
MTTGKVLALYMTMPDMMKLGHRMVCEDFECDPDGIIGDMHYETSDNPMLLLTCQKSYELVEEAELAIDVGVLLESILVDINLYHLKAGAVIELGETLFEVLGACEAYGYLMALAPELPEVLKGNRGIFVRALDQGVVAMGDEVKIIKEA